MPASTGASSIIAIQISQSIIVLLDDWWGGGRTHGTPPLLPSLIVAFGLEREDAQLAELHLV